MEWQWFTFDMVSVFHNLSVSVLIFAFSSFRTTSCSVDDFCQSLCIFSASQFSVLVLLSCRLQKTESMRHHQVRCRQPLSQALLITSSPCSLLSVMTKLSGNSTLSGWPMTLSSRCLDTFIMVPVSRKRSNVVTTFSKCNQCSASSSEYWSDRWVGFNGLSDLCQCVLLQQF